MRIPLIERAKLLAMLPVSAGTDPYASLILGNPAICLTPCMRCNVRVADVQVHELYVSLLEKSIPV